MYGFEQKISGRKGISMIDIKDVSLNLNKRDFGSCFPETAGRENLWSGGKQWKWKDDVDEMCLWIYSPNIRNRVS